MLCPRCYRPLEICIHRPFLAAKKKADELSKKLKQDYFGPSASIFVGHEGYPNVRIGPLQAIESEAETDFSKLFGGTYEQNIEFFSSQLRSKFAHPVKLKTRFIEQNQELAIASKPIDVEAHFKKKPTFELRFSKITQPQGPTAELQVMRLTSNVKVDLPVEKVLGDELKSTEAARLLYSKGIDIYKLSNILSSGILGLEKNRKLTPTRWSVTAIDSLIANGLISKIKDFKQIEDYEVFESSYLGNHHIILLSPSIWEFENFEAFVPTINLGAKSWIGVEYEPYAGRKKYSETQGGGLYAIRLAIAEYLHKINKQAQVIAFREISDEYSIPLGVWIVRETVRNAFKSKPMKFSTKEEALKYIEFKLRLPLTKYVEKSQVLRQKKLSDFFLISKHYK